MPLHGAVDDDDPTPAPAVSTAPAPARRTVPAALWFTLGVLVGCALTSCATGVGAALLALVSGS